MNESIIAERKGFVNNKPNVKYFIAISTYNREKYVKELVDGIVIQKGINYIINVIDDDSSVPFEYNHTNVNVIVHNSNYGKKMYWKTVNEHLALFSKTNCTHFLQIDDDFILKKDFFSKLYENIGKHPYKIIKIHLDNRHGSKMWGFKDWVDGGACYPKSFIEMINYRINPINETRWKHNPLISSGVWNQMTVMIHKHRYKIYSPSESLVSHIGNESVMNPEARIIKPITSI